MTLPKVKIWFTKAQGYAGHTSLDGVLTDCGKRVDRRAGRHFEPCGSCARIRRSRSRKA